MSTIHSTKQKKIEDDGTPLELTTEFILVGAIKRGLTLKDFEVMTIGMIMDYIITYNNMHLEEEEETIKEATQADFDAF